MRRLSDDEVRVLVESDAVKSSTDNIGRVYEILRVYEFKGHEKMYVVVAVKAGRVYYSVQEQGILTNQVRYMEAPLDFGGVFRNHPFFPAAERKNIPGKTLLEGLEQVRQLELGAS